MTDSTTTAEVIHDLDVNRIRRNPRIDPRKSRNKESYTAFVESVRDRGVQQPITVRPVEGDPYHDYEVVAGNTRWNGTIDAGRATVPSIIRIMTDEEAIQFAIIENVQRRDLTPIEEARAAKDLLAQTGNDQVEVMRILGWSQTKLNSRVLLTHACSEVEDALLQGQIKIGHAELLCPLEPAAQAVILGKIIAAGMSVIDAKNRLMALTRSIEKATFDTTGCVGCAHNSSTFADMFDDSVGKGQCQNLTCWTEKVSSHMEASITAAKEDYALVYRSDQLPAGGYTVIATDGNQGIGTEQVGACRSCESYGAVVNAQNGKEGITTGRHCFNLECHKGKVEEYQNLVILATQGNVQPAESAAKTDGDSAAGSDKQAKVGKNAKAKSAAPRELRKALKRIRHETNVKLAQREVRQNKNYAYAQAIFTLMKHLVGGVGTEKIKEITSGFGIADRPYSEHEAAVWTAKLAKQPTELLTDLIVRLGVLNLERSVTNDAYDTSEGAALSRSVVEQEGLAYEDAFLVDQAYLDALTKEELLDDCKFSGFAIAYDEKHGEGSFKKLANGKVKDLGKAMLALEGFDWKGYLPPLFGNKATKGTDTALAA
ncbi:PRTRC system ParB family protein (plasmid) [Halopseudomonas sp. SMJS2]|uniref:PRTRC system ParB family protein n=1 Tax=Halopseudomonas sp. SMJS2 TaxID=3041098 RepID=UPI002453031D|nr:PRTRC system ParB family protein [Halopseudomonas sp. SMJS2]WGK63404.1 PRTRC system ParB family protein [Halopseudomonas sp. SMJS2]